MKKKNATFYIEETVLKQAKREIPNLSAFVENCFKTYLNITGGDNNVQSMQDELNNIKTARLNIHLLSESNFNGAEVKEYDTKKQNNTWIKLWGNYRNTETIIDADILNAGDILGKSYSEIIDIMQDLLTYLPRTELAKCDDWQIALKEYENLNR